MRLTLRTMLAYLDDVLEPDDHAEIEQKIAESEFASELMHKIRDVTLRLRLDAPPLTGRGLGADPNSVAEYLDNRLAPDRLAELERICLESDVHLAEVASCHQILTLVLGEPAAFPQTLREKMYNIPMVAAEMASTAAANSAAAKSAAAKSGIGKAGVVTPPLPMATPLNVPQTNASANSHGAAHAAHDHSDKPRREPEIPDYLRESRRSRIRSAIGMALVALLVAAGLTLYLNKDLRKLVFGPPADPTRVIAEKGGEAEIFDPSKAPHTGETKKPFDTGLAPPGDPLAPGEIPAEIPGARPTIPAVPGSGTSSEPGVEPAVPPAPGEAPIPGETPPGEPKGTEPPAAVVPGTTPPASVPGTEVPGTTPPGIPAGPGETPPAGTPPGEVPPAGAVPGGAAPATGAPAALLTSSKTLLLREDKSTGRWQRLPARATIGFGEPILALPGSRPTLTLSQGSIVQLGGGTLVVLTPPDANRVPGVEIIYGRAIFLGASGNKLQLHFGSQTYPVGFSDANTTLAVEVRRVLQPGADPEAAPAPVQVDLYAASGRVVWGEGATAVEVPAPMHRQIPPGPSPDKPVVLPPWIDAEPLAWTEQRASLILESSITDERPVAIVLTELIEKKQLEVQALAARAGIHIGLFGPFVGTLNDSDQRGSWAGHIETLRAAIALNPATAKQVREAFQAKRGEDGAALYRMLWGYTDKDLHDGAAKKLVEYLDHPSLDFRVLAFWNLKTITGLGLNYQPEYPDARRRGSVSRWQEKLKAGEIHHPSGPSVPGAAAVLPGTAPEPSGEVPGLEIPPIAP